MKIREATSRVKNTFKAVKQDAAGLSDRYIYSLILKYGKTLMRRQDNLNRLLKYNSIWKPLPCVPIDNVEKVPDSCGCIISGCQIKRTVKPLPEFIDGYWGVLIRFVTSIDQSLELKPTNAVAYEKMLKQKNFKYNKTLYYWYSDGHLYFPNIDWDAVRIEGIFEGDTSEYNDDDTDDCVYAQDRDCPIPDYLFAEIEKFIAEELGITLRIPPDQQHDNLNVIE
jgi:hypothetical protein